MSLTSFKAAIFASTSALSSGLTLSEPSFKVFSAIEINWSAWFLASTTSLRLRSSAACDSASFFMRSTSSEDKLEEPCIVMCCSLLVALSFAFTVKIPLASMSKVTSI